MKGHFLAGGEKIGSKKVILIKNSQLENFIITFFFKYLILLKPNMLKTKYIQKHLA